MASLAIWVGKTDPNEPHPIYGMGNALLVAPMQTCSVWFTEHAAISIGDWGDPIATLERHAPARSISGSLLWMIGEIYDAADRIAVSDPASTETVDFRTRLLQVIEHDGLDSIRNFDGEYLIVVWSEKDQSLSIANDRFGALPTYFAAKGKGVAVCSGVRGVLMAPGVSSAADDDAIREAVTFGGYRLGDRTNVVDVKMLPAAAVTRIAPTGAVSVRRYWSWNDVPRNAEAPLSETIQRVDSLWKHAIRKRLSPAARHGQTLSGGLDSRAILAEAAPQLDRWIALTYGVDGCDDMHFAQKAAARLRATWCFYPLYSGDWIQRRLQYLHVTDGLIDLTDLMHLESLHIQRDLFDIHLSGYIGDAVSGPTFNDVVSSADALRSMPFYLTPVSAYTQEAAQQRIASEVERIKPASTRFVLFDHKIQQSTNRWTAAFRNWFKVRRPFVDYAFFDYCQGLPTNVRGEQNLHARWLLSVYPHLFLDIPNQKTGVAVGASSLQKQFARARRFGRRMLQRPLRSIGVPVRSRIRAYTDDLGAWSRQPARERIEKTILRSESLVCEILGRNAVTEVVRRWFANGSAPAQVIGSMFIYEEYHASLRGFLRSISRIPPAHQSARIVSAVSDKGASVWMS